MVPFNKPFLTGNELSYIKNAVENGKLSGNGKFTNLCHSFFESKYGFKKCLLTSSCTDALEMTAILANIQINDEVIMPSYTFVSTALAFVRQGAIIRFVDSNNENPNLDTDLIETLINDKTKAIVVVHYAGIACDMEKVMTLANRHNLIVIEDTAQAIDSYYKNRPLGSIGHMSTFSFHETKNIISGEGGLLVVNDESLMKRAEIIWEKGTNRAEYFRGEINKYGWVDIGSSFLASEITAAFLYAQLEKITEIQTKRKELWSYYSDKLLNVSKKLKFKFPAIPEYATNNAHMFYIVFEKIETRDLVIEILKKNKISAVFHYISLHSSEYYQNKHDGRCLPNSDRYSDTLLRLPLFYELKIEEIDMIVDVLNNINEK